MKPPKYYDTQMEKEEPYLLGEIKNERMVYAQNNTDDQKRLNERQSIKQTKLDKLERELK